MAYRLTRNRSIAAEVWRIADKQLTLALRELREMGGSQRDAAIHDARRHLKKLRAVLRLVRPAVGPAFHRANTRIRRASRLLGPIADAESAVNTLRKLTSDRRGRLSTAAVATLRTALRVRAARIDRQARFGRVLRTVRAVLRAEQQALNTWHLADAGFHVVSAGVEASCRRARKAMVRAMRHPTDDRYHAWRRKAKELWLQIRLLEDRCGHALEADERRLRMLDDYLGEHRDLVLIQQIIEAEAPLSRRTAASVLRVIKDRRLELRDRADALGTRTFRARDGRFHRKLEALWRNSESDPPNNASRRDAA
jgi:CHAD domain-containing protein